MIEILAFLEYFKEPILNTSKDLKDELIQIIDNQLATYLESQTEKYGKIKTFLFRHNRVEFYKIYFQVSLRSVNKTIQLKSVSNLFEKSNFATIIGNAGSGKSMMFKHLFLQSLNEREYIPIVIELRNLNRFEGNLRDYIHNILIDNKLGANRRIVDRMLNSGKFLFLLDGYDEIYKSKKEAITTSINNFIDLHKNNKVVISSRPGADIELLPRFENYYVNPLTKKEAKEFANQQYKIKLKDNNIPIENINDVIENSKDIGAYLKNPLLLSMFILTYDIRPDVPKKRSDFYSNVYNALCLEHNALSKPGYQHPKESSLSNSEIEEILKVFSFYTFFNGDYSFSYSNIKDTLNKILNKKFKNLLFEPDKLIKDITVAIPILLKDGVEYKFPHRSLQEYFAALFIKELGTEQKVRIYESKMQILSVNSTDSFQNFWGLCMELDKNSFLKHFIIPTLEKFLTIVNSKNDNSLINSFFSFLDLKLAIEFYKEDIYKNGILKYKSINFSSGEIIKSSWNNEFELYKKVFRYLNLFKFYNITELLHPETILENCNADWLETVAKLPFQGLNKIEYINDIYQDDFIDSNSSRDYLENIYINVIEQTDFDLEKSGYYENSELVIQVFDINNAIDDINRFSNQTKITPLIKSLIKKIVCLIDSLNNEILLDQKFNENLLDDI